MNNSNSITITLGPTTLVANGQAAVVSLMAETAITANFGADGKLTGSAGCNNYTAAYQTAGNTITISPAAATRKACPQPEGLMAQETQYLAALETAATYQLRGDKLELRTADGALAVTFAGSGQTGSSWALPVGLPSLYWISQSISIAVNLSLLHGYCHDRSFSYIGT